MSGWQDIPQDVWAAAERQVSAELSGHSRAHKTSHGLKLIVARTILAAKAEERRGCLAALEVERDENASGEGEVYIAERMISAIRKREG